MPAIRFGQRPLARKRSSSKVARRSMRAGILYSCIISVVLGLCKKWMVDVKQVMAILVVLAMVGIAWGGEVRTMRVLEGGIQPPVAGDERGTVHLLYYNGPEAHGDLFYAKSVDGGVSFSKPMRVNSQEGSAVATGTIRGGI